MTRPSLARAARGIIAGVAVLAVVVVFLLFQFGGVPLSVLAALIAVGVGALVIAAGPSAVGEVFGGNRTPADGDETASDWWLANLEPALKDSWNRWSDLVFVVGLAGLGVGSFALLVLSSGDEPPVGLLITGFFGVTGTVIALPFVFQDRWM